MPRAASGACARPRKPSGHVESPVAICAVLAAYGLAPGTPEPEIVAHLFKLYADKMKE